MHRALLLGSSAVRTLTDKAQIKQAIAQLREHRRDGQVQRGAS
ncbi:hypothetical protein [Mycetohabitans sp. B46]